MDKIIKFFNLIPQPGVSIQNDLSDGKKLNKMFSEIFDKPVDDKITYEFTGENDTFRFDILEKNGDYLFGTCCKEETFKNDLLLQKRIIKSNITGPYTQNPNELMERFTYFIIDYNSCKLAAIHNHAMPSINKILAEFVYSTTNCNRIETHPVQIDNIDKHLGKYKSCKEIILHNSENTPNEIMIPLRESLSDSCTLGKYRISISIKDSEPGFFKKIVNLSRKNAKYRNLSLIALNEYGLEDTINLVETFLTKRVPIELSKDTVFNKQKIKDTLIRELNNIIYK